MRVRLLVVAVAASLTLAGCMTGPRPTLVDAPSDEPVGDPAIDAVLELLEEPPMAGGALTVSYDVLRKFGDLQTTATLARDETRWSLTVGKIRYLALGGERSTCNIRRGICRSGFDESRISDVLTTSGFAEEAAVARMRRDADAKVAPGRASTRTIAEQDATCVDIDVSGGTVTYCAVPEGLLVLQDTADIRFEATSFDEVADDSWFDTVG